MLRSLKVSLSFLVVCTTVLLFGDRILAFFFGPLSPIQQRTGEFILILLISAGTFFVSRNRSRLLTSTDNEYRQLFDLNPNPLWIYNNSTLRIVRVNDAAIEKYGYSREKFMRMTIADIRPFQERERMEAKLKEHDCGSCLSGQWKHLKADGGIIEVSIVSYPVTFDNQPCCLVIANDITELLEKEHKLEEAYQKIKNFNETLRQIAWSNSHEMRKPVCSIISLVSLLQHTDNDRERRQYLNLLETAASELDEVLKHNEKMTEFEMAPAVETVS
ncbi:MAG TPA: PAS domain-containing protein [Mucilaginibacter sp.]|nr:PAS domain-containing protein [Mucilaginibacter sp.]